MSASRLPVADAAAQPGQHIVTLADADYPQSLLTADDPPVLLYAKGNTELLNCPMLAIVVEGALMDVALLTWRGAALASFALAGGLAVSDRLRVMEIPVTTELARGNPHLLRPDADGFKVLSNAGPRFR